VNIPTSPPLTTPLFHFSEKKKEKCALNNLKELQKIVAINFILLTALEQHRNKSQSAFISVNTN